MALREKTVTIECDAHGNGTEDVNLGTLAESRFTALVGVEVPSEDNTNFRRTNIDIYEVQDYDVSDGTVDVYGPLVFHLFGARQDFLYQPRVVTHTDSVDQAASPGQASSANSTGEENGLLRVRSSRLRVDVTGATASSTFDVRLLVQSAGDQRF